MERPEAYKVTVVIPCGTGHRSYVTDAVRSCVVGREKPDAIIVVDDGCVPELDRFDLNAAEVIRVPERIGRSRARNLAISRATTPWLFFLDADDRMESTAIADFLEIVGGRATDLVFADYDWIDGDERFRLSKELPADTVRSTHPQNPINIGMFMRRERVIAVGGFDDDMEIGEYWDLYLRYIQNPRVRVTKHVRPFFVAQKRGSVRTEPQKLMDKATRKIQAMIRGRYYRTWRGV